MQMKYFLYLTICNWIENFQVHISVSMLFKLLNNKKRENFRCSSIEQKSNTDVNQNFYNFFFSEKSKKTNFAFLKSI